MNLMLAFATSLNIAFAIIFHYIFHCIFHGIWILLVPEFLWKVSKFFWMLGGHAAGCKYYATDVSQTTFWWIWWWGLLGRWKFTSETSFACVSQGGISGKLGEFWKTRFQHQILTIRIRFLGFHSSRWCCEWWLVQGCARQQKLLAASF